MKIAIRKRSVEVVMPWRNLGCLSVRIGPVYLDLFRRPQWGIFLTNGAVRVWFMLGTGTIRVDNRVFKAVTR